MIFRKSHRIYLFKFEKLTIGVNEHPASMGFGLKTYTLGQTPFCRRMIPEINFFAILIQVVALKIDLICIIFSLTLYTGRPLNLWTKVYTPLRFNSRLAFLFVKPEITFITIDIEASGTSGETSETSGDVGNSILVTVA